MNAASSASAASEQATVTPVLGAADESKMSEAMLRLRRENELRERRAREKEAWQLAQKSEAARINAAVREKR